MISRDHQVRVIEPRGEETFSSEMVNANRYMNWIVDSFSPFIGKNILEVGVGHGGYGDILETYGNYMGIDISDELIEELNCRNSRRVYLRADVTNSADISVLKKYSVDTVVCVNVLEHIDNQELAIKNMFDLLEPGGHLVIFVPAFMDLYSEMDRLAGHYRRYKLNDLKNLSQLVSGQIVTTRYFNSIGGAGWWLNKLSKPKSLNDKNVNSQIKFFDKYIVPVARKMDILTHSFFGQSALIVLRNC